MNENEPRIRVSRRYRYTEYYTSEQRTRPDGGTETVLRYTGPYLMAEHDPDFYRKSRCRLLFLSCAALLAQILLLSVKGFSVYRGGSYVMIPATAGLPAALYIFWGALKLPKEDGKLQLDVFRLAHERIQKSAVALLIMTGLTLALTVVFASVSAAIFSSRDLLFFVLEAVLVISSAQCLKTVKQLRYNRDGPSGKK